MLLKYRAFLPGVRESATTVNLHVDFPNLQSYLMRPTYIPSIWSYQQDFFEAKDGLGVKTLAQVKFREFCPGLYIRWRRSKKFCESINRIDWS